MDYKEALSLAKAGDQKGFEFLYTETYKSKYYLALQYMKNEEAAKDILQEAYMKAFSKIAMLERAEAFPGWLGVIVANTAKNSLSKKNPLLFSDVTVDEEGEGFELEIEDENLDHQPEIVYTREETRELVQELIGGLPEEQRISILLFHIEGASIKEIASAMECSENTVKSRLKYGRDNLKNKAEELQKKGYKLYSAAPLPLLLYLLRLDRDYMIMGDSVAAIGEIVKDNLFHHSAALNDVKIAKKGVDVSSNILKVVKGGFWRTIGGKVILTLVGCCVVGSAIFYGISRQDNKKPEHKYEETSKGKDNDVKEEQEEKKSKKDQWREAYAELIQDAPNKTYFAGDLAVVSPTINYCLLDMDGNAIPELLIMVTPGGDGELGTLSFRNGLIYLYQYNMGEGVKLIYETSRYMPELLKNKENNLIFFEIGSMNGRATYYSVKMEDGKLYEEKVYSGLFPSYEYSDTFNQEHGFEALKYSAVNDKTMILEYGKGESLSTVTNPENNFIVDSKQEEYIGSYDNSEHDSVSIMVDQTGKLKMIRDDRELLLDMNNKKADGSITAYSEKSGIDTSFTIAIYPVGVELMAWNHQADALQSTDTTKIRIQLLYQDVPDIRTNVFTKTDRKLVGIED